VPDTLTFLFTDIQDSSRMWDEHPEPMRQSLALHNEIVLSAVADHGGTIVKDLGDGYFAVFGGASEAVGAALQAQQGLTVADWEEPVGPLRVRVGVHTGTAEVRGDDYIGPEVNRAARLEAAAHGGQVLVSEATRALTQDGLPPEAELRDLGYHTLRGLARPERVYQLIATGLPTNFPELRTVHRGRSTFPTFVTSFIGRSSELDDISGRLRETDTRMLTLLGPGGIGKTRLAVETANQVGPEFPGGTAFTDLVRVSDPDGISLAVAQAIGAHPEGSVPVIDIVLAEISNPTLLVLDNFEHLIVGSPIVADMIGRCQDLTLLVTSRTPLRIRGEIIYQIEPLGLASGNGSTPAAVDLFIERAAENGVEIDANGPEGEAVLSICRRLDGLPLAIELAAARVRLLSVTELDRKLADSLAAVGSGAADLPERQQTIQSTIDWSVEALTPDQQTLFNRLSIFPAGATLEQVEQVATVGLDGDPLDLVSALVDHSLLAVASDLPGGTRFRQLTVLREYASDRLREADALDDTMAQLVDHYVATTPATAVLMQRGGAMIANLEFDYPNLSAAMEWSLAAGRGDEMVRVVFALWPVWFNGDLAVESAAWVRQADEVSSSPEADWLQGLFAFQFGDMETASARFQKALNRFEKAGDRQGVAMAKTFAGALTPDPAAGEMLLSEAQEYFDEEGQLLGRFIAEIMTSVVVVAAGDLERALVLRRELLPAAEEYGYDTLIGWTHWNIATALIGLGRTEEAAGHNALAFSMLSAYGYQEGIGSAGEVEAIIAVERGDPARAAIIHGGCRGIFERLEIELWWEVGPLIEEATASALEQLGGTEYERLFAQGKELTLGELAEMIDSGLGVPATT
jgi:predicted ATPase/class 3 adenylate cyclase